MTITKETIRKAYLHIKEKIKKTPLVYAPELSKISGANVYLKMEQTQITGSFKIRGVLAKMNTISKENFHKTFVAASTGNHAAAFAYAAKIFRYKGKLFMPLHIEKEKLKGIETSSIEKELYGASSKEAEKRAREYAREVNGVLIHPYNDKDIITGQGTVALEIEEQLPKVDRVLVPIGGGGLISGVCAYFSKNDEVKVIGCQPENASEMYESIKKNKIVASSKLVTIADAAAGGIEENSLTFDICKKELSGIEILEEENIKKAVAFVLKYHQTIIEPTAALPVAALLESKKYKGKNVVLILTGKKINQQLLNEIKENYGDYY